MEEDNKILEENLLQEQTSEIKNEESEEVNSETNISESNVSLDDLGTTLNEKALQEIGIDFEKKQSEESQITDNVKNNLENDLTKIEQLVQCGLLNQNMGRNLKKHVLQKAFDNIVESEKSKAANNSKYKIFEEFTQKSGDFFKYEGRKDVLNYLQNEVSEIGLKDLDKISEIVKIVEKSAISRYLTKIAHDKSINESNEQAKQKLTTNAQNASAGINLSQSFTREQIGKMSCTEFAKYEKAIMKQLREGKIR